MNNSTTETLSHCGGMVRDSDRDRFLRGLFATGEAREALFALYALDVELRHIHHVVGEEMIGHVRYAWWQEAVENIYAGNSPRGHPVLQALQPVIVAGGIPPTALYSIISGYRESFPELPVDAEALVENTAELLLLNIYPHALPGWRKAGTVIEKHRRRYGGRGNGWLAAKLIMFGIIRH